MNINVVYASTTAEFQPIYYNKQTININLPINVERMIKLPFKAKIHAQSAISNKIDIVINDDVLLIKANSAFISGRAKIVSLQAQLNHPIILLSFTANANNQSVKPLEIIVPSLIKTQSNHRAKDVYNPLGKTGNNRPVEHPFKKLSRYAMQVAFAPERFIEPSDGVVRMHLFQGDLPLYEGGAFSTKVREGYRLGNVFATVIEVSNNMSIGQDFDPRRIRGKWLARSAYMYHLRAKGTAQGSTAVVLMSAMPFEDAVGSYIKLGVRNGQIN